MHFVTTQRGEASYVQSPLWQAGEWRRHLIAGAQQAVDTHLPAVTWGRNLDEVIDSLRHDGARIALDNYEATIALSAAEFAEPLTLALGPEPGWSAKELERLCAGGFTLAHLGIRVIRSETACVVALTIARTRLGLL
jgi:RsmE family RNA methyltransferase